MTERVRPGLADACGADVAVYALRALEPAEVDAFRRHLRACVVCRDELASFQQVVDVLPVSAARRAAPKGLKRTVLTAVKEASRQQRRGRRRRPLVAARPAVAIAAVLVAISIAIGILQLSASFSPPTRIYGAQVTGSAGSAEIRETDGQAELVVRGIAPPPAGHIYEVWLVRGRHAPQPTRALFGVTARGDADVDVPGNLRFVRRVLVTPEPAGGSEVPTHDPMITAQLT